jgi:beta-glucosidase
MELKEETEIFYLKHTEVAASILKEMTVEEKLTQLSHKNKAIPRLGLKPYVWWNEALHGLARSGSATVFPQAIGLAASFDTKTVFKMGKIIAIEGRARHHESLKKEDYGTYKGLTYWSPNVNIFRDPRWGRGHETYGEDPFLSGEMGSAYVKGVQGENDSYYKAIATPKHYAVHSGPEATRLSFDSQADERDLRETYLPAFKKCFESGAQSVMTAYNAYNGDPCATNTYLNKDILRNEWEFKGVIVTDAGAPEALHLEHKRSEDLAESVANIINNGVDVLVGFEGDIDSAIQEAHQRSLFKQEEIDRAIFNQLLIKAKLGFFSNENEVPLSETPYEVIECAEHRETAKEAIRKSLVLLKNKNNSLPLKKENIQNIAIIGPNADTKDVLLGNYFGTPSYYSTPLQGFQKYLEKERCRVWHARGCELTSWRTEMCAEDEDRYSEAISVAERSDAVILCLGLNPTIEGEAGDAFNAEAGGDKLDIQLHKPQEKLIEQIAKVGKPIIVLMFAGSCVVSKAIEKHADALIQCWYPGAEAGEIIAETVFGENNPGGRLPVTFYKTLEQLPPFESYQMEGRTYKFMSTEPLYPFGYGLSYSSFKYSEFQITEQTDSIQATVTVKNISNIIGDEVIQIYASQAADFRTPHRKLIAFSRITLAARNEEKVCLSIPKEELLLIDPNGLTVKDSNPIILSVGGSQNDKRSIELTNNTPLQTKITLS